MNLIQKYCTNKLFLLDSPNYLDYNILRKGGNDGN